MGQRRNYLTIIGLFRYAAAILALLCTQTVTAQTEIRPRFFIAFDTSGSMALDPDGVPSFGDGVPGVTEGLDTDCDGEADDSRVYIAKEALRNVVLAYGELEFALGRFPQYSETEIICNREAVPGNYRGNRIQDIECSGFLSSIGNPANNTGTVLTTSNCGANWNGFPGVELPTSGIPAACRPNSIRSVDPNTGPRVCLNYLPGCPGSTESVSGYVFPEGDVLVGFEGFGWPDTTDNRTGILRWIDNQESNFDPDITEGDFCNHSANGDCELRVSGATPLAGVLRAAADYMIPIRAADPEPCRPYTVLLLTDGFETCGDDPVAEAANLFANNIAVYVLGLAVDTGSQSLLNSIAASGGTTSAFFANDPISLADGLADIVRDSLLIEECGGGDEDCDGLVDEGFVKYCDVPNGITTPTLCDPVDESVCDGGDDNCNGLIDEGVTNACGACGVVPAETCNGSDDDCDLRIDEGGVCTNCAREPEICDGLDNDCDNSVDESLSRSCGLSLGVCTPGTQACTAGGWGDCVGGIVPSAESCDGLDNDCNGAVDDLSRPCGSSTGECSPGTQQCIGNGLWSACQGGVEERDEVCDNLDNDCDGITDEAIAGLGASCGVAVGDCAAGTTACVQGTVICEGGSIPSGELCDGEDNDCDSLIDEGLGVGAPCGTDVGECSPGFLSCVDGSSICTGAIESVSETCDGLDNDCDGGVDEGLGLGQICGDTVGVCSPGTLRCADGQEICDGEVPIGSEVCDCQDNDCDGSIDEDAEEISLCPGSSACVSCQCALPCGTGEFGLSCPTGRVPSTESGQCYCIADACDNESCGQETIDLDGETLCAPDSDLVTACVCKNNECTFSCDGVVCSSGTVCNFRDPLGSCTEDSCRGLGCRSTEICSFETGICEPDPCLDASCAAEEACRLGACEPSCADANCADDERCVRGVCVEDRCADVSCTSSEVCLQDSGSCITNPCSAVLCPTGTLCNPQNGNCEQDPCDLLRCPAAQSCFEGECRFDTMPSEPPETKSDEEDTTPNRRVLVTGGGASCAASGAAPPHTLLALMMFVFASLMMRSRRIYGKGRRRASLMRPFLFIIAVLAPVTGCDVSPFCLDCDESAEPAPDGSIVGAKDASGGDPADATVGDAGTIDSPDACSPDGSEECNNFDDDCDGRVDEGVDTQADPNHCGGCGMLCAPPQAFGICDEGTCTMGDCDVGWFDLDGEESNGCEYRCIPSAVDDTLCDRRDNDCDGAVDEDVQFESDPENCGGCAQRCAFSRAVTSCSNSTCLLETCEANFFDIDEISSNGCEYACVPADGGAELCNAVDDDCDGTIDEGNPEGGTACGETTGRCDVGIEVCSGGSLVCTNTIGPFVETCNGSDDDCDGLTDETTLFDVDPLNCGFCGNTCDAPQAISQCITGNCVLAGCMPGFADITSEPGCETACVNAGSEVCNGADDDCDGTIDEQLTMPSNFCLNFGVCVGTQPVCTGTGGWSCSYPSTFQDPETVCDGIDNDCDSLSDEGFSVGEPCGVGTGSCRVTGLTQCASDGAGTECSVQTPGDPVDERCNGEDDDCDGAVDEGVDPANIDTVRLSIAGATVDVFQFEASRADATSSEAGILSTAACSVADRIPWTSVTWSEAEEACCALNDGGQCPATSTTDGWRLCDVDDWEAACAGPSSNCTWSYENNCTSSASLTCNGTEFDCDPGASGVQNCISPTQNSTSFASCRTSWPAGPIYDLSGNVKEWTNTEVAPDVHAIRGGSYNNLEEGRTCAFDFTVGDETFRFPNVGFRCCYYDF